MKALSYWLVLIGLLTVFSCKDPTCHEIGSPESMEISLRPYVEDSISRVYLLDPRYPSLQKESIQIYDIYDSDTSKVNLESSYASIRVSSGIIDIDFGRKFESLYSTLTTPNSVIDTSFKQIIRIDTISEVDLSGTVRLESGGPNCLVGGQILVTSVSLRDIVADTLLFELEPIQFDPINPNVLINYEIQL